MEKRKKVAIQVDGAVVEAYEGEPIAAALVAAGIMVFRTTRKRKEPRRIFCAVGRCTDCVMTVDGQPNVRTCVTPVRDGMEIWTQKGHESYTYRDSCGRQRSSGTGSGHRS